MVKMRTAVSWEMRVKDSRHDLLNEKPFTDVMFQSFTSFAPLTLLLMLLYAHSQTL